MCPCISSKSIYATCNRHESGLVCPTIFERDNYCFSLYELCPVFLGVSVSEDIAIEIPKLACGDLAYV